MCSWLSLAHSVVYGFVLFTIGSGLECACTTEECMDKKAHTCYATTLCYSETYVDPIFKKAIVTRGCIDGSTPIMCENKRPKKLRTAWPSLYCCGKTFCNKDIIPTSPPEEENEDLFDEEYNKVEPTQAPSSKCSQNNNKNNSMINPIYIAVPVAGVCVLLALIIFAMYLLRRRNDYIDSRYQYPKTVSVPHHHQQCNETKCVSACKLNRCTDSERSSSGSETKLFL